MGAEAGARADSCFLEAVEGRGAEAEAGLVISCLTVGPVWESMQGL